MLHLVDDADRYICKICMQLRDRLVVSVVALEKDVPNPGLFECLTLPFSVPPPPNGVFLWYRTMLLKP